MPEKWSKKRERQYDKVRKPRRDRGESAGRGQGKGTMGRSKMSKRQLKSALNAK